MIYHDHKYHSMQNITQKLCMKRSSRHLFKCKYNYFLQVQQFLLCSVVNDALPVRAASRLRDRLGGAILALRPVFWLQEDLLFGNQAAHELSSGTYSKVSSSSPRRAIIIVW